VSQLSHLTHTANALFLASVSVQGMVIGRTGHFRAFPHHHQGCLVRVILFKNAKMFKTESVHRILSWAQWYDILSSDTTKCAAKMQGQAEATLEQMQQVQHIRLNAIQIVIREMVKRGRVVLSQYAQIRTGGGKAIMHVLCTYMNSHTRFSIACYAMQELIRHYARMNSA
jgi:predicted metal-dependent RNase